MKPTYKQCAARALELSKAENTIKEDNYNIINKKNLDNYNIISLKVLVNTEKSMVLAQSWGVYPGALTNLCKEYGFEFVRRCIQKVASFSDGYFNQGQAIPPQRGRFLRGLIHREGQQQAG